MRNVLALSSSLALLGGAILLAPGCPSDADGDGFTEAEGDCAPDDGTIYPGAVELEDGIDNDCDGAVDEVDTGDDDDATGDDDDATQSDPGDLDTTEAVTGDWSCKGNQGQPTPGGVVDMTGFIEDFEDDVAVSGATVRIWPGNDPDSGVAGASEFTSDEQGNVAINQVVSTCTPYSVYVFKDWNPALTYPTYQSNFMLPANAPYNETFTSVSFSTYNLVALSLGLEVEPGKGIAAGRVRDCNDVPVANGEITVGELDLATGDITEPEGYSTRYFLDDSPNLGSNNITDDGLFGAINLPPGDSWSVLLWGIPQDEAHCDTTTGGDVIWNTENDALCLLGTSSVFVIPDSVNVANINLIAFPPDCAAVDG
ncbi:MAG: putative metal-binding motif-containing protein [Deltaproteobacteria bacterium]|nr:putative metal-binding motif-containing protein [Deltaproteobacteria bacterium]